MRRQDLVKQIKVEDRKMEAARKKRDKLLAALGPLDLDVRPGDEVIFNGRRSRLERIMYSGYDEDYTPDDWHARVTPYKKDGKLQIKSKLVFNPRTELRKPTGDLDGR